jgi:hypothetical protein
MVLEASIPSSADFPTGWTSSEQDRVGRIYKQVNSLYYGDNLDVLRKNVAPESVDLVYLDPPFNSSRSYNVLFRSPAGVGSAAQIQAFDDTWCWSQQTDSTLDRLIGGGEAPAHVADALTAIRHLPGRERAEMGILLSLEKPTPGMAGEDTQSGTYTTEGPGLHGRGPLRGASAEDAARDPAVLQSERVGWPAVRTPTLVAEPAGTYRKKKSAG